MALKNRSAKKFLYTNTLVFSLITAAVSVILLALLATIKALAEYKALIVTIEAGLLAIIIAAIIKITMHERAVRAVQSNIAQTRITVDTCPDFYKAAHDKDKIRCDNVYTTEGGNTYSFAGSNDYHKSQIGTIYLNDLSENKLQDVCDQINNKYSSIPWTSLRPQCTGFNL